jgi:hypothetical protein
MKKLILILIVLSSQSFAQQQSTLPYGVLLEHTDAKYSKEQFTFFENGKVTRIYYYDSTGNGLFNTKATQEGVWNSGGNMYSIRTYLGTFECTYDIKKIADVFVFQVSLYSNPVYNCFQKLLRIKKD